MRLLTLKVIQPDETSTALIYDSTPTVRADVTMQLILRQPPTRSSGIIHYIMVIELSGVQFGLKSYA